MIAEERPELGFNRWEEEEHWMEPPVKDERELFFNLLYPKISGDICRNVIVYGAQGMGRTEFLKYMVKEAYDRYGREKVYARVGHVDALVDTMRWILVSKPVRLLLVDDFPAKKCKHIGEFFTARYGQDGEGGLTVRALVTHDLFAIPSAYRNYFDFMVVLSTPVNDYDYNWLERRVGKKNMVILERLTSFKFMGQKKEWKMFWTLGGHKGFFTTPIVKDIDLPLLRPTETPSASDNVSRILEMLKEKKYEFPWTLTKPRRRREEEEDEGMEWYLDEEEE